MAPGDCFLYAELHPNIRQISLAASLSSASNPSTRIAISADCKTVELRHGSSAHQLILPAKASFGGVVLPIQERQQGSSTLTWRIPPDLSSLPTSRETEALPWSSLDLTSLSEVTCRQCSSIVVPHDIIRTWKDLPSENWAEMMEFWHCHKPYNHEHHKGKDGKADERTLASRGYGASSAISAQEGIGLIDLTAFLFSETDCQNIVVSLLAHFLRRIHPPAR